MNVSVIIPNYCHARFLNQRIDSVLNQTYSDYEVIILDDCSTDNSREIIESYRNHPKISHIVYNEKNSGSTFIQWERGFELARGEYIWIAESDDVARSTFLEECMNAFSSYSDVSIVFSDCLFVDENTRDMHESKLQLTYRLSDKKQDSPYTMYNGRFFIDHRMFYQNYIMNASMVVFRKNSRHPDKAYMNYRYVGDWLFWVGILLNGNTVYIDKQLNLFRQHAGNTTSTSFSSGNNYKEMGRLMTDICRIVQPPTGFKPYLYGYFFVHLRRHFKKMKYNPFIVKEIFDEWARNENRTFSIIWYRIAKWLCLYKDKRPFRP